MLIVTIILQDAQKFCMLALDGAALLARLEDAALLALDGDLLELDGTTLLARLDGAALLTRLKDAALLALDGATLLMPNSATLLTLLEDHACSARGCYPARAA